MEGLKQACLGVKGLLKTYLCSQQNSGKPWGAQLIFFGIFAQHIQIKDSSFHGALVKEKHFEGQSGSIAFLIKSKLIKLWCMELGHGHETNVSYHVFFVDKCCFVANASTPGLQLLRLLWISTIPMLRVICRGNSCLGACARVGFHNGKLNHPYLKL